MDETVNAVVEEVVTPQVVEETAELKADVSESVNSEVAPETEVQKPEDKPKQSAEDNAKYADVRRKAETEAKDKLVREMQKQFKWDESITTYDAYQKAMMAEQVKKEAEEKGVDPEFLSSVKEKEKRLAEYEKKEERNKMYLDFRTKFPKVDYKAVPPEIWKSVEDGGNLKDLYTTYAYDKMIAEAEAKNKIAEANEANEQASTGSAKSKGQDDNQYFTQEFFDKHKGEKGWVAKNYNKVMASYNHWKET